MDASSSSSLGSKRPRPDDDGSLPSAKMSNSASSAASNGAAIASLPPTQQQVLAALLAQQAARASATGATVAASTNAQLLQLQAALLLQQQQQQQQQQQAMRLLALQARAAGGDAQARALLSLLLQRQQAQAATGVAAAALSSHSAAAPPSATLLSQLAALAGSGSSSSSSSGGRAVPVAAPAAHAGGASSTATASGASVVTGALGPTSGSASAAGAAEGAEAGAGAEGEAGAGAEGEAHDQDGTAAFDLEATLSAPYAPGCILEYPDVLTMALRIAAYFEADFSDKESERKVGSLQRGVQATEAALSEAQSAATMALDKVAASQATTLSNKLASLQRSLETAVRTKANRYRRNLRDSLLRVTLLQGASTVNATAGDMAGEGLDVARPTLKCDNCDNEEEGSFLTDPKQADVICTKCGLVVADNNLHDGDWTRSFEGEESSSQIGPPPDPLLSNRYNLRTGMALSVGVSKSKMRALRLMSEAVEMGSGSSAAGLADKRTRLGYKDRMKLRARQALDAAGERLEMAPPVIDRACQLFAAFRDNREHLTAYEETLSACLSAAYEESVFNRLCSDRSARAQTDQEAAETAAADMQGLAAGTWSEGVAGGGGEGRPAPLPAPVVLSEAVLAARQAVADKRKRERNDLEERKARALGLLGSSNLLAAGESSSSSGGSSGSDSDSEEVDSDEEAARAVRRAPGRGGQGGGGGAMQRMAMARSERAAAAGTEDERGKLNAIIDRAHAKLG